MLTAKPINRFCLLGVLALLFNACLFAEERAVPTKYSAFLDAVNATKSATSLFTGSIHLDEPKVLCLSIPYSKGWSATVDGQETQLVRVNTMYLGLALEPGDHDIELHYRTPYLAAGTGVSIVALADAIALAAMLRKRRNNTNAADGEGA